ncbi:unnamed protein product [Adineta ricciae]|uniref:Uncharacterized protein n=1 Tax=Adineta ricciae TaxID=249248 RepID=A0A815XSG8_ADIRI|nr:unnamed protein product [Adineta ricciae]
MQEGDQSVKFVQKNLNTLKQLINNSNRKRTLSMSSTITTSSDDSSAKQRRLDTDESLIDCDKKVLVFFTVTTPKPTPKPTPTNSPVFFPTPIPQIFDFITPVQYTKTKVYVAFRTFPVCFS